MKTLYSLAFGASLVFSVSANAQNVYTWKVSSGNLNDATNWNPIRLLPLFTDVLVVDGNTTASAELGLSLASTIGQLRFINNANARLVANANTTLTIGANLSGPDLEISAGSKLRIYTSGNKSFSISLPSGNTASINGALEFGGSNGSAADIISLVSPGTAAIVFNSGGSLTTLPNFSGSPFGTANGSSVVFKAGSSYIHNIGDGPFGLPQPASVVTFDSGSSAIYRTTSGMDLAGRSFGNLTIQNNISVVKSATTGLFKCYNLTIDSGSSFSFDGSGSSSVEIKGNISSAGNGNIYVKSGTVIRMSGTDEQTIGLGTGKGTISLTDLHLASGSKVKLARNITVTTPGLVDVASGASLNTTTRTISGGAGFTLQTGGTVITALSTGLPGAILVSGTRSYSSNGNYEFNGASTGGFVTTPLPNTVNNLTINAPAGVQLSQDFFVAGNLQMASGKLFLGSSNLLIGGAIESASADRYVVTNGTGSLTRLTGSTELLFPVGNSSYNPASIQNTGTADNFSVRVADTVYANGVSGAGLTGPRVNRTWFISEANDGGSNATLKLQWNTGEDRGLFSYSHVYVTHHNGTAWENYGVTPGLTPPATGYPGNGPYSVVKSGLTRFSPFSVGSPGFNPLPIHLVDFNAVNHGEINVLTWHTANEDPGDHLEVERSRDGQSFEKLVAMDGKGPNSSYTYTDTDPYEGNNYYRLRLLEVANNVTYSNVVVAIKNGKSVIFLYPNPAGEQLYVLANHTSGTLYINDMSGRILLRTELREGVNPIGLGSLPEGVYLVNYEGTIYNETQTVKIRRATEQHSLQKTK